MSYAQGSKVPVDRSQSEIRKTLRRYGAGQFICADDWEGGQVMIGFVHNGFTVKVTVPLPRPTDRAVTHGPGGKTRTEKQAENAYGQAIRSRWRALLLLVKGRLEEVEMGVSTFERAFMSYLVLPSGETVGDRMLPQISNGVAKGKMPKGLPLFGDAP